VSTVTSVANVSSRVTTVVSTVADGAVTRDTSIAVVNPSDDSNVVGVSGGVGIVLGKTVGNLSESVGFGIRVSLSLTLAVAVRVSTVTSVANVSSRVTTVVATVSNSSVAGDTSMAVVNPSDHSNIMGVSSGIGIGLGKTVGNLA